MTFKVEFKIHDLFYRDWTHERTIAIDGQLPLEFIRGDYALFAGDKVITENNCPVLLHCQDSLVFLEAICEGKNAILELFFEARMFARVFDKRVVFSPTSFEEIRSSTQNSMAEFGFEVIEKSYLQLLNELKTSLKVLGPEACSIFWETVRYMRVRKGLRNSDQLR